MFITVQTIWGVVDITIQEFSIPSKFIFWWFISVENHQDFEFLAVMYQCWSMAKVVLTWLFLESIEFLPRYLVGTFGEIRLTRVLLFSYEPWVLSFPIQVEVAPSSLPSLKLIGVILASRLICSPIFLNLRPKNKSRILITPFVDFKIWIVINKVSC